MKISTKGCYALRLMVDFAMYDTGEYISLREVSERQNLSFKYMEQIVNQLVKAGLLLSVRGANGGYKLAHKPKEYTVEDILQVTEGSLAPVQCLDTATGKCEQGGNCTLNDFWQGLYKIMQEYMHNTTLQDLLDNAQQEIELDYMI